MIVVRLSVQEDPIFVLYDKAKTIFPVSLAKFMIIEVKLSLSILVKYISYSAFQRNLYAYFTNPLLVYGHVLKRICTQLEIGCACMLKIE